jgi:malate/lactate dehydrogenase
VYALSTLLPKGYLPGVNDDVFLSLPCACGQNGIKDIVRMRLNDTEIESMRQSAVLLIELTKQINL